MYHKMMTTEPDQSYRNVRVQTRLNINQLGKHAQRTLLDPSFEVANPPPSAQNYQAPSRLFSGEEGEEGYVSVVDRNTVKKLANLVVTQEDLAAQKLMKKKRRQEEELMW